MCKSRFVMTVRDPVDIIGSMLQVSQLQPSPESIDEKMEELARQGIEDSLWLREHPAVLTLRYEEFYGNFDYLISALEGFLDVRIERPAREVFEERFNIASVRKRAHELQTFDRFSSDDQIHGRHISCRDGRPGSHRATIALMDQKRIFHRFRPFAEAFGYQQGNPESS